MDNQILPVLDLEALKKAANDAAMKGALKSIEEYYTGYNSPFKKVIEEELSKTEINYPLYLPNIMALINEKLTSEIDLIANTAVAKSFVPLVQRFLTREQKEIKFSDLLKEFIECTDSEDMEDCDVDVNSNNSHGWLNVTISGKDKSYELTLHEDYDTKKEVVKKYQILSIPNDRERYKETMKVSLDGVTLEMPFTRDVLSDGFSSYIARLIIGRSKITMDCRGFDEDMFPRDECHCD